MSKQDPFGSGSDKGGVRVGSAVPPCRTLALALAPALAPALALALAMAAKHCYVASLFGEEAERGCTMACAKHGSGEEVRCGPRHPRVVWVWSGPRRGGARVGSLARSPNPFPSSVAATLVLCGTQKPEGGRRASGSAPRA